MSHKLQVKGMRQWVYLGQTSFKGVAGLNNLAKQNKESTIRHAWLQQNESIIILCS